MRRLERDGLIVSKWEQQSIADAAQRPPRDYYRLTKSGRSTLQAARKRYPLLERMVRRMRLEHHPPVDLAVAVANENLLRDLDFSGAGSRSGEGRLFISRSVWRTQCWCWLWRWRAYGRSHWFMRARLPVPRLRSLCRWAPVFLCCSARSGGHCTISGGAVRSACACRRIPPEWGSRRVTSSHGAAPSGCVRAATGCCTFLNCRPAGSALSGWLCVDASWASLFPSGGA